MRFAEPFKIDSDEQPWTQGDSHIAIENNEPLGAVEVMFAIKDADGDPIAYMPWTGTLDDTDRNVAVVVAIQRLNQQIARDKMLRGVIAKLAQDAGVFDQDGKRIKA